MPKGITYEDMIAARPPAPVYDVIIVTEHNGDDVYVAAAPVGTCNPSVRDLADDPHEWRAFSSASLEMFECSRFSRRRKGERSGRLVPNAQEVFGLVTEQLLTYGSEIHSTRSNQTPREPGAIPAHSDSNVCTVHRAHLSEEGMRYLRSLPNFLG
jgi:hypothetical protein